MTEADFFLLSFCPRVSFEVESDFLSGFCGHSGGVGDTGAALIPSEAVAGRPLPGCVPLCVAQNHISFCFVIVTLTGSGLVPRATVLC